MRIYVVSAATTKSNNISGNQIHVLKGVLKGLIYRQDVRTSKIEHSLRIRHIQLQT